jgi:mycothiol synthase
MAGCDENVLLRNPTRFRHRRGAGIKEGWTMAIQTGFSSRPYSDADLHAVTDLFNACDAVDKMDDNYAPEDLRTEFDDPDLDKSFDLRLWEESDGSLAGFGQVLLRPMESDRAIDGDLRLRVRPDIRNQGLEDGVVAWAEARTREKGEEQGLSARLQAETRDYDAYGRAIFERHGMSVVRYFFEMRRELTQPIDEPSFPEGFKLVHSRGVQDAAAWVDLFNQSFIDHWNHHPATVETQIHWIESPKYSQERDLIAVAPDSTFAAFCFCWVDPEANERNSRSEGWIDMLGTRRGFRKIGLGRAMLLAGLLRLREEGLKIARLGVDSENPTGALRLYESVGFVTEHTWVAYSKSV